MSKSIQKRILFKTSLFNKSALLATSSVILASGAASAGEKNDAFQLFQQANPGLEHGELKQLFKQEWKMAGQGAVNSVVLQAGASPSMSSALQNIAPPMPVSVNASVNFVPAGSLTIEAPINLPVLPDTGTVTVAGSNPTSTGGNITVVPSAGTLNLSTGGSITVLPDAGAVNLSASNGASSGVVNTGANVSGANVSGANFDAPTGNFNVNAPAVTPVSLTSNGAITVSGTVNVGFPNLGSVGATKESVKAAEQAQKQQLKMEQKALQMQEKALLQAQKLQQQQIPKVEMVQDIGSKLVSNNFALDLGSTTENITLGSSLFKTVQSVTIEVGGESKTLAAGSKVTAAEYIAAKQVLNAGGQTVTLNNEGAATGGSVDLSALTAGSKTMKIDDLHVASGVTAYGDFGKGGDVRISGDLSNAGEIVAYSSIKNAAAANIRAGSIVNGDGASISAGLNSDLGGLVDEINLGLYATTNLSNFGDICASGNVTLSAGTSLTNSGQVFAQHAVNIAAPNVTNTGSVVANMGNLNLDSSVASALNVVNTGGTLSALNGAINLRPASFKGAYDTNVFGGDLLSEDLNINAGRGTANVGVNELTGEVHSTGLAVHVQADTDVLAIGKQCLTGDPTYYNTGDITIVGDVQVSEALAIIAGGSITTSLTGTINIEAIDGNSQGYDIAIIAGANVTPGSGELSPPGGPADLPGSQATTPVTFNTNSTSGGSINLSSATVNIRSNSSGAGDKAGGNILLAAFADANGDLGDVIIGTGGVINASGANNGTNGNITVIAGGTDASVVLPTLLSSGTSASGGNVFIATAQPTTSDSTAITYAVDGTVSSGNSLVASATIATAGSVVLEGMSANSATIRAGAVVVGDGAGSSVDAEQSIDIQTSSLTFLNNSSLNAGNVLIQNLGTSSLTISATSGSISGTNPGPGAPGSPNLPSVIIETNGANLTLNGTMTINGDAQITADNGAGTTTVSTGSTWTGTNNITLITGTFDMQGSLTASNLIFFRGATIVNTEGDVVLDKNVTFDGHDFAILARDTINLGGANISLNGGNLTLVAGYDFQPTSGGQQESPLSFSTLNLNATGTGNIVGTGMISTSNTDGDGGNITAIANGGSISLGIVDARSLSGGDGGVIQIIATGNISATRLQTNGSVGVEKIQVVSGAPVIADSGFFSVTNGTSTGDGFEAEVQPIGGDVFIVEANSGFAKTTIETSGNNSVTIGDPGIVANEISVSTGLLIKNGVGEIRALQDVDGNGGTIELLFATYQSTSNLLTLDATGTGTGDGGTIIVGNASLNSLGEAGALTLKANALGTGDGGDVILESFGDVTLNNGAINVSGVNAGTAQVITEGNITLNGTLNMAASNGSAGALVLAAGVDGSGSLFLNNLSVFNQFNATGNDGSGGYIELSGQRIVYASSSATPLNLSANGIGTGNGGYVSYATADLTALFVGAPAVPPKKGPVNIITVSAVSGQNGGNGGVIEITNGGALTVTTSGLDAGPQATTGDWDGATYFLQGGTFSNGKAPLIVLGDLDASAVGNGAGGAIGLISNSKTTFTLGGVASPKNGTTGQLTANGFEGFIGVANTLGSIQVNTLNALNAPFISLELDSKGTISTAGAGRIIAGEGLQLLAPNGSIGGKAPVAIRTPELVAAAGGTINVSSDYSGTLNVLAAQGLKGVTISSSNSVLLGDIFTQKGSITVVAATGLLEVADEATLTANSGALVLQNLDTVSGSIRIGEGATVQTLMKGKAVSIAIGPVPKKGTNPVTDATAPPGMDVFLVGRGQVFIGPAGVDVNGNVTVNAINKSVIFNVTGGQSIVLENGSIVTADPPSPVESGSSSVVFTSTSQNAIRSADLSVPSISADPNSQAAQDQSVALLTGSRYASDAAKLALLQSAKRGSPASAQQSDDDNSYMVGQLRPDSFTNAAICSDTVFSSNNGEELSYGVRRIAHASNMSLKNGMVLFAPHKDTVVETPMGVVKLSADSVVLISCTDVGLAIYDLDDRHKGAVVVQAGGHSITLSPGRHAMVSKHHEAEFGQINAIETVAHRNIVSQVKGATRAHLSEFFIPSALDTVLPLRAMMTSKQVATKRVADKMMKTAAVVLSIGSGVSKYQHYFKPRITAMNK